MKSLILSLALATGALAQTGAYGQCGGIGFTGSTSCVSGYVCTYENDYYSQCVPGTATTTTAATSTTSVKTSTTSTAATSTSTASGKFKWFGVDESCAEFGEDEYPGTWGIDFTFPSNSSLQVS